MPGVISSISFSIADFYHFIHQANQLNLQTGYFCEPL
jgi:hypothetical protein